MREDECGPYMRSSNVLYGGIDWNIGFSFAFSSSGVPATTVRKNTALVKDPETLWIQTFSLGGADTSHAYVDVELIDALEGYTLSDQVGT